MSERAKNTGKHESAASSAAHSLGAHLHGARADLLRTIRSKIGDRLGADVAADEILQESILRLLAGPHGADPDLALSRRRIVVIAENQIRSLARRRDHPAFALDALPSDASDAAAERARGEARLRAREAHARVRRLLSELPIEQRMVIVMRHWLGTSWETITAVLGRPSLHAAHCLHYRALRALERKLRTERGAPPGGE